MFLLNSHLPDQDRDDHLSPLCNQYSNSPLVLSNHWSYFYHHKIGLSALKFHGDGITVWTVLYLTFFTQYNLCKIYLWISGVHFLYWILFQCKRRTELFIYLLRDLPPSSVFVFLWIKMCYKNLCIFLWVYIFISLW